MKKFLLIIMTLLFTGCSDVPVIFSSDNYKGEPIQVSDNLYFKQVRIQNMYVLLQCDKYGKIIHNQNTNAGYTHGKVFLNTAVITPQEVIESDENFNFNFKCSDINDCYNQIIIVKNSIKNKEK